MAVFKFRLKTLHRLKKQLEDQAKNRLGLAVAALDAEKYKLRLIHAAIAAAVDDFRRLSGGRFTAGKIKAFNYFLAAQREKAEIQAVAVDKAQKVVDEARHALLLAARQREAYDKLRDKAYARYAEDERHAEGVVVDEIVSYRGNTQAV